MNSDIDPDDDDNSPAEEPTFLTLFIVDLLVPLAMLVLGVIVIACLLKLFVHGWNSL